jgi:hypothetical protein
VFRGQLFAGRLFAGRLFGVEQEVTPQPTLDLEYHGGGGDLVERVLDKWRVIEEARARRSSNNAARKFNKRPASKAPLDKRITVEIESLRDSRIENEDRTQVGNDRTQAGNVIQPVYQFVPQAKEPVRVAPTKSAPATLQAAVDDGLEEVMAVLLALEEAGEL